MGINSASCVDKLIGDLQENSITTFYGPPAIGKSTISFMYAIQTFKQGKKVIFIDTEGGFSSERLLQMDPECKLSDILVFSPKSFEQQQKIMFNLSKEIKNNDDVGLIVVDSLVMLYRLKLGDAPQKINKELSEQLRLLNEISRNFKIPILAINQMYNNFDTGEAKMVGGSILEYWSKTILLMDKDLERRNVILKKHKFRREGVQIYFNINNEGIYD